MNDDDSEDHLNALSAWLLQHREAIVELELMMGVQNGSESLLLLPVSRFGYHGLFIELIGSPDNRQFPRLINQGYSVHLCKTWIEARDAILAYLQ